MTEKRAPDLVILRPRPAQRYIARNHTVLITGENGFINHDRPEGLLIYQTRSLSKYRYLIDGDEISPVSLSEVTEDAWMGYYARPVSTDGLKGTIEVRISRVADEGLHEEIEVTGYVMRAVRFQLALELDADFADQSEIGGTGRKAHGACRKEWRRSGSQWELRFDYHASRPYQHPGESGVADFHQSIAVQIAHSGSEPQYSEGCISFPIELQPREVWHACINVTAEVFEKTLVPRVSCRASHADQAQDERERFLSNDAAQFTTPGSDSLSSTVIEAVRRASRDLVSLRLHDYPQYEGWPPAAGYPTFGALYGRDSICASWQASLLSTAMLRGTLPALALLQGCKDNAWRDEQPEKMIHQSSHGLLSQLEFNPFTRYYGSLTTSAVYPFALAALWQWTGETDLVRPFLGPALKALHWRDTGGDLDQDGFSEYLCRSEAGLKNQGWKDSGDAIVNTDGSQAEPPIAPCEEQGFLYIAKLRMAEMLWWLGERAEAARIFHQASELKKRFNEAFWMEPEGFFAMGLDGRKRQIRSIASNPGHLLETGIVDSDLARRTADRLMAPDLFSGWGVRTLSADHPAYDPFSYQRGSVWPAENGLFALGMLRFGFHEYVERICRGQFEAAALFQHHRLPEVFCGHPRDADHPFPAVYRDANWPQAWSASGVFCLLYSILGIFPYAPLKTLFVDPHLPDWLPEISVRNLHLGKAIAEIRFWRKKDGKSDYRIINVEGDLHVIRQPSPWSLSATLGERFQDALMSLTPGR